MKKIIEGKKEKLEKLAAKIIAGKVKEISLKKKEVILGIPGGRSVKGIFEKLRKALIDWTKVHIFMIDERFVPLDNQESNFKMAKENFISDLIKKGLLPRDNVHPFKYDSSKEDGGTKDYEKEFLKYGKAYDIVLLGAGEDGHIASLFPNHPSIKDDSEYFVKVENSPKPPAQRISASRKLLLKSNTALLLFFGESKKSAYNLFLDSKISQESCPAKLVEKMKESFALSDL